MNYRYNGIVNGKFANFDLVKEKGKDRNKGTWMPIYIYILWYSRLSSTSQHDVWGKSRDASSVIFLYLPLYILHGATSLWQVKVIAPFSLSYLLYLTMYILFISVYICTCVWTRESERERASNMFSQFSCVGTQMNTNIVYQFLYFT